MMKVIYGCDWCEARRDADNDDEYPEGWLETYCGLLCSDCHAAMANAVREATEATRLSRRAALPASSKAAGRGTEGT